MELRHACSTLYYQPLHIATPLLSINAVFFRIYIRFVALLLFLNQTFWLRDPCAPRINWPPPSIPILICTLERSCYLRPPCWRF